MALYGYRNVHGVPKSNDIPLSGKLYLKFRVINFSSNV